MTVKHPIVPEVATGRQIYFHEKIFMCRLKTIRINESGKCAGKLECNKILVYLKNEVGSPKNMT